MKPINIIPLSLLVVFLSFLLIFLGALLAAKDTKTDTKIAVGGFIGPIPFGFGNDKWLLLAVIVLAAAVALVFLVLRLRG